MTTAQPSHVGKAEQRLGDDMTYIDYITITAEENAARAIREAELQITEDVDPQDHPSPYDEPCIDGTFDDREPLQVEQPENRYTPAEQILNPCLGDVDEHDYTVIDEASITYQRCRHCGQELILD